MALMVDPRVAEVFVHSYSTINSMFLYKDISEECAAYQIVERGDGNVIRISYHSHSLTRYSKHSQVGSARATLMSITSADKLFYCALY